MTDKEPGSYADLVRRLRQGMQGDVHGAVVAMDKGAWAIEAQATQLEAEHTRVAKLRAALERVLDAFDVTPELSEEFDARDVALAECRRVLAETEPV